ncbi:MAG TPA: cytochrome c [Vicinamibacterales bacterium]|nr:cytochrome c [Vicinamibacterales bacterium]
MLTTSMKGTVLPLTALAIAAAMALPVRAAAQDAAQIKRGQEVYAAQKCQTCHSIAGKGKKQNPLDGVGKKLSADEIRQWIVDPVAMAKKAESKKKPPMQNKYSKLPAADIDALVAYMVSLK